MLRNIRLCDVCAGAMPPPAPPSIILAGAAGHREMDVCDGCADVTSVAKLRIIAATPQTVEEPPAA